MRSSEALLQKWSERALDESATSVETILGSNYGNQIGALRYPEVLKTCERHWPVGLLPLSSFLYILAFASRTKIKFVNLWQCDAICMNGHTDRTKLYLWPAPCLTPHQRLTCIETRWITPLHRFTWVYYVTIPRLTSKYYVVSTCFNTRVTQLHRSEPRTL